MNSTSGDKGQTPPEPLVTKKKISEDEWCNISRSNTIVKDTQFSDELELDLNLINELLSDEQAIDHVLSDQWQSHQESYEQELIDTDLIDKLLINQMLIDNKVIDQELINELNNQFEFDSSQLEELDKKNFKTSLDSAVIKERDNSDKKQDNVDKERANGDEEQDNIIKERDLSDKEEYILIKDQDNDKEQDNVIKERDNIDKKPYNIIKENYNLNKQQDSKPVMNQTNQSKNLNYFKEKLEIPNYFEEFLVPNYNQLIHHQISTITYNMSLYTQVQVTIKTCQPVHFNITLLKSDTISFLANLIETHYTFYLKNQTVFPTLHNPTDYLNQNDSKLTSNPPLICGKLIYKGKDLNFLHSVGATLHSNAEVHPINYFLPSVLSSFPLNVNINLYQLLHDKTFSNLFFNCCKLHYQLDWLAFWYEVEALKKFPSSNAYLHFNYIYNTFIASMAPFHLNFPIHLIEKIPFPLKNSHRFSFSSILDQVQYFAYITLLFIYRNHFINSSSYDQIQSMNHLNLTFNSYSQDWDLILHPYHVTDLITLKGTNWGLERLLERILNQFFSPSFLSNYIYESQLIKYPELAHHHFKLRKHKVHRFFGEVPDPILLSNYHQSDSESDPDSNPHLTYHNSNLTHDPNLNSEVSLDSQLESQLNSQSEPDSIRSKNLRQILGAEAPNMNPLRGHLNSHYINPKYLQSSQLTSKQRQLLARRLRKLRSMLGDDIHSDKVTSQDSSRENSHHSVESDTSSFSTISSDDSLSQPSEPSNTLRQFKKLCHILGTRDGLYTLSGETPIAHLVPRSIFPKSFQPSHNFRSRLEAVRSIEKLCSILGERPPCIQIPPYKDLPPESQRNSQDDLQVNPLMNHLNDPQIDPYTILSPSSPTIPNKGLLLRHRIVKLQKLLGEDLRLDPKMVTVLPRIKNQDKLSPKKEGGSRGNKVRVGGWYRPKGVRMGRRSSAPHHG